MRHLLLSLALCVVGTAAAAEPLSILPPAPAVTPPAVKAQSKPRARPKQRHEPRPITPPRPIAVPPRATAAPTLPAAPPPTPAPPAPAPSAPPPVAKAQLPEDPLAPVIRQYCAALAPRAEEKRRAWQMRELEALERRLEERIAQLEARRVAVETVLADQKKRANEATASVVALYGRMRPDAAAAQLASMEEAMAASILAMLQPKVASLIVNELEPAVAARLARAIARGPEPEKKS